MADAGDARSVSPLPAQSAPLPAQPSTPERAAASPQPQTPERAASPQPQTPERVAAPARPPGSGRAARGGSAPTTYKVERPRKAGPPAIAAKTVLTLVFVATATVCAYRAAVPAATPHGRIPATLLAAGFAGAALTATILAVAGVFWVLRGARFADTLVFAIVWPIATVLMVILAGASAVPQHYLRAHYLMVPGGVAAAAMMIAVAWVYNRPSGR
jgi:hypothetical protein